MNIADRMAGIALAVSARVGAGYWTAMVVTQSAPTFDDGGSIIAPGVRLERPCSAQVDSASEAMRAAEGYTDGDVRILILSGTLAGALDTDAVMVVSAGPHVGRYSLQSVLLDVAGTHWDCGGRAIGA